MALLPASFVVVGTWPGLHRWLYVGIPGLLLALYATLGARLGPRSRVAVLVVLLLGSAALTERAIPVWRSDATLFSAMIEESPDDPFGYQALAVEMLRLGHPEAATDLLRQAIKLGPTHEAVYTYLAVASARLGRCDEAVRIYAAHPDPLVSEGSFQLDLGECLIRVGRYAQARPLLQRCAAQLPACADALSRMPP
jgi:tetratricopeptide (TPR) repeat protein